MITHAKILTGWPSSLTALADRRFEFTPGLNILFGENGSGKSTLLKAIGAYSGCDDHGGWSFYVKGFDDPTPFDASRQEKEKWVYPRLFCGRAPHSNSFPKAYSESDVGWDGMATFFHNAEMADRPIVDFEGTDQDGLFSYMEKMQLKTSTSSGQTRLAQIIKLREQVATKKLDLTDPDYYTRHKNGHRTKYKDASEWVKEPIDKFIKYVMTLPRTGPITILLDEPERSMDIPMQECFWTEVIPTLKCQIIVASHSVFALSAKGANVIGMDGTESVDRARASLKRAFT